ncbi:MAG TPA: hypothetical protein VF069_14235 [Streptosporangiaceae bacterium]
MGEESNRHHPEAAPKRPDTADLDRPLGEVIDSLNHRLDGLVGRAADVERALDS